MVIMADKHSQGGTQWPGPFTSYTRQAVFRMAEPAISSNLFAALLQHIARLGFPETLAGYTGKYARWPQPMGILSVATYVERNNPGVEVERPIDCANAEGIDCQPRDGMA